MKKGKKIYEGKAKIIYSTPDKNLIIQYNKKTIGRNMAKSIELKSM